MKCWKSVLLWRLVRRLIPPGLLLFTAFAAWMLSSGRQTWWLNIIRDFAEYEVFHLVAHFCLFGAVGLLLGSAAGDVPWWGGWTAWGFVLAGTLLIEGAQLIAVRLPLGAPTLHAALRDLFVNSLGAASGILMQQMAAA